LEVEPYHSSGKKDGAREEKFTFFITSQTKGKSQKERKEALYLAPRSQSSHDPMEKYAKKKKGRMKCLKTILWWRQKGKGKRIAGGGRGEGGEFMVLTFQ